MESACWKQDAFGELRARLDEALVKVAEHDRCTRVLLCDVLPRVGEFDLKNIIQTIRGVLCFFVLPDLLIWVGFGAAMGFTIHYDFYDFVYFLTFWLFCDVLPRVGEYYWH